MKKIAKIQIVEETDTTPDTSWLGEYGPTFKSRYDIDRRKRKDQKRNEFQYFHAPIENYKGENPEDIKKYVEQDYQRFEAYNRDEWWFIGIKAIAEIRTSDDGKNWLINHISSGGLWGIESDCNNDDKKEVGNGQIFELERTLKELGFTQEEIDEAKKTMEVFQ